MYMNFYTHRNAYFFLSFLCSLFYIVILFFTWNCEIWLYRRLWTFYKWIKPPDFWTWLPTNIVEFNSVKSLRIQSQEAWIFNPPNKSQRSRCDSVGDCWTLLDSFLSFASISSASFILFCLYENKLSLSTNKSNPRHLYSPFNSRN